MDLIYAVIVGDLERVEALVEEHFDESYVNFQDSEGYTAIHHASFNGYKDITQELLNIGANIRIKNNAGSYPQDLAKAYADATGNNATLDVFIRDFSAFGHEHAADTVGYLVQPEVDQGIRNYIRESKCTIGYTGRNYQTQPWLYCKTCGLVGNEGVCISCALVCHEGHELDFSGMRFSRFYCDCGSKGDPCTCRDH